MWCMRAEVWGGERRRGPDVVLTCLMWPCFGLQHVCYEPLTSLLSSYTRPAMVLRHV